MVSATEALSEWVISGRAIVTIELSRAPMNSPMVVLIRTIHLYSRSRPADTPVVIRLASRAWPAAHPRPSTLWPGDEADFHQPLSASSAGTETLRAPVVRRASERSTRDYAPDAAAP